MNTRYRMPTIIAPDSTGDASAPLYDFMFGALSRADDPFYHHVWFAHQRDHPDRHPLHLSQVQGFACVVNLYRREATFTLEVDCDGRSSEHHSFPTVSLDDGSRAAEIALIMSGTALLQTPDALSMRVSVALPPANGVIEFACVPLWSIHVETDSGSTKADEFGYEPPSAENTRRVAPHKHRLLDTLCDFLDEKRTNPPSRGW